MDSRIRALERDGTRHRVAESKPERDMSGIPLKTESSTRPRDRTAIVAGWFAIVLSVAEVILDLGTWVELDIATIYGIPLVLAAFTRDRRLLWGLMIVLVLVTFIAYAVQVPSGSFALHEALFVNRALDAIALLLIAGLLHIWMASLDVRESQARLLHEQNDRLEAQARLLHEQNSRLEAANALLVAHEARIVRQNEELSRRRHEAEEASGRKTRLLNAVSHDIRNSANTINLIAEVIRRSAEDPAFVANLPRMAGRLQANTQSLVALVSEVLDGAHLDSGLLQRHESTFSLNEFAEAKCRDVAAMAEAKSLHLRCESAERIVSVRSDRMKLDRIVTNLVTNAIKFTTSGGITVSVAVTDDGAAVIRVRDTGIGMSASELERIFDEFVQVDRSVRNADRGWGLGLAISRRLAHFIGASISAESEPGRGSVFTVRLPSEYLVNIAPIALPDTIA
jgi:signal transduction histidine kinase